MVRSSLIIKSTSNYQHNCFLVIIEKTIFLFKENIYFAHILFAIINNLIKLNLIFYLFSMFLNVLNLEKHFFLNDKLKASSSSARTKRNHSF